MLFIILYPFNIFGQDSNEPHAKIINKDSAPYAPQEYYDNPLFVNINLSFDPNPQNEPSVRISRMTPNVIVAAWRDFRLGYSPPVRRIGYTYSTNGGLNWAASQLLPSPLPEHATQSDPVLTTDANNNFYIATTSREQTNTRGETVIYKSTNLGVNWVKYSVAASSSLFEDKEWITCDLVPGSPYYNSLYITWTRIGSGIKFIKSTNAGLNWTTPVNIGDNTGGQGSNVSVGTNNSIYVVWFNNGVKFDYSTNGGTSFNSDYSLTTTGNQIMGSFPFICVDYSTRPSRGNVYVVIADNRQGTGDDVWFQRSTNGGASWLPTPVRINDVTTNDQFWPVIQCDTNGTLYCQYYDERDAVNQFNSYIAYSTDQGTTWINQRLSSQSFPFTYVNSDVRQGDYIGIDTYAGKVIPVWMDDRAGTPNQEIYTAYLNNIVSAEITSTRIPENFELYQNYPNPFNPGTQIKFSVPKSNFIKLTVYNSLGKEVKTLVNEQLNAGTYEVKFDASALSSGVYFYNLKVNNKIVNTKSMVLVK